MTLFDLLDTIWIMSLFDEFTEAVDTIRDLQFHATKADNDKSFSFYLNQIFNLTLVGLITLRGCAFFQMGRTWVFHL